MLKIEDIQDALNKINAKIGTFNAETYQALSSCMASLTPQEIVAYQETKSIAQVEGKIALGVALWIYKTIGHWATSPIADKVLITQLMASWLGVKTHS